MQLLNISIHVRVQVPGYQINLLNRMSFPAHLNFQVSVSQHF